MALTSTVMNMNGRIVSETRGGTQRFYTHDALGSVVEVRDSAGTKTDSYSYWPYGEIRLSTGSTVNPWRFSGAWGYYFDGSSYYVRAREYRPDLSRWWTVDPLWPNEQEYQYGQSSPTVLYDPMGLAVCLPDPCKGCETAKDLCKWYEKTFPGTVQVGFVACCKGRKEACVSQSFDKDYGHIPEPTRGKIKACVRASEVWHRDRPGICARMEKGNWIPSDCGRMGVPIKQEQREECLSDGVEMECAQKTFPDACKNNPESYECLYQCTICIDAKTHCKATPKDFKWNGWCKKWCWKYLK